MYNEVVVETKTSKTRALYTASNVLLCVAGVMAVILIIGTIVGLTRRSEMATESPLIAAGERSQVQEDDIRVFSGLGQQRIPLAGNSVLILSIAFPYQASDIAFTEELAGKIAEFRKIAADYFSSLPFEQTVNINEEAAKTEILKRYNESLRLGFLPALYFSDMMILDAN